MILVAIGITLMGIIAWILKITLLVFIVFCICMYCGFEAVYLWYDGQTYNEYWFAVGWIIIILIGYRIFSNIVRRIL